MSYIILTRNPSNNKVIVLNDGDERETVSEFKTESEANRVAQLTPVCSAWGYQIVEAD